MRQAESNNPIHSSKHTDSTNHTQHNNSLSVYHKCNEDLNTISTHSTQTIPSPTSTPCPPIVNPSPPPHNDTQFQKSTQIKICFAKPLPQI